MNITCIRWSNAVGSGQIYQKALRGLFDLAPLPLRYLIISWYSKNKFLLLKSIFAVTCFNQDILKSVLFANCCSNWSIFYDNRNESQSEGKVALHHIQCMSHAFLNFSSQKYFIWFVASDMIGTLPLQFTLNSYKTSLISPLTG